MKPKDIAAWKVRIVQTHRPDGRLETAIMKSRAGNVHRHDIARTGST